MPASPNCPYCGRQSFTKVATTRARHPHHETVVCGECDSYSVRHQNGVVYPLKDRTDKESDAGLRVTDG